jgi:hypothetical protein
MTNKEARLQHYVTTESALMLEHCLATNSPLANLEDMVDVKNSQVLLMITVITPCSYTVFHQV